MNTDSSICPPAECALREAACEYHRSSTAGVLTQAMVKTHGQQVQHPGRSGCGIGFGHAPDRGHGGVSPATLALCLPNRNVLMRPVCAAAKSVPMDAKYGGSRRKSALKMRGAYELFSKMAPHIECDGELQGDAALSEDMRNNIPICPNLDATNILFNVLKVIGGHGVIVGPILLGVAAPAHVLTPSATVRRVVNMTPLAACYTVERKVSNLLACRV